MIEAIERIERYASRGREAFDRDELIQNWFVHHLQILGEAARAMPEDIKSAAPAIPWAKIIGMRHVLVHDYFGIDRDVVWNAVEKELPALARELRTLIEQIQREGAS